MEILKGLWLTKIGFALMMVFGIGGLAVGILGNIELMWTGIGLMWVVGYPLAVGQVIWRMFKLL